MTQMNHLNFPMNKPIPLEVIGEFADKIDWSDIYGRYGTADSVYPDLYYGDKEVPAHLKGLVTHVRIYFEK